MITCSIIKDAPLLARAKNRDTLHQPIDKKVSDKDKVFLTTTYHQDDQFVPTIARQNWPILDRNPTMKSLFHRIHLWKQATQKPEGSIMQNEDRKTTIADPTTMTMLAMPH